MTFTVNVKDGTDAGRRRAKQRPDWFCRCERGDVGQFPRWHSGDTYSCPDCGTRRPA